MELETTFYVVGIIFMSLMTLILLALVVTVFAIKAKINAIHDRIEDKFRNIIDMIQMGEAIVHKAQNFAGRHKK